LKRTAAIRESSWKPRIVGYEVECLSDKVRLVKSANTTRSSNELTVAITATGERPYGPEWLTVTKRNLLIEQNESEFKRSIPVDAKNLAQAAASA
jgi:hypothetical protein